MAAPEVRAVGTVAAGVAAISPGLPAGVDAGDLLIMVTESQGAGSALTATNWTKMAEQTVGGTRLSVLYKRACGPDTTTTNDTGDHQVGRIMAIKAGSWNWDEVPPHAQSAKGEQASTKAVSIPGGTTTLAECLIVACASRDLPDATSTTEFSAQANANLGSVTERVDNATVEGDGGAIYMITGTLATAKEWGATTGTAVTAAVSATYSFAIDPVRTNFTDRPFPIGVGVKVWEVNNTGDEITMPAGHAKGDLILIDVYMGANKVITVTRTGSEVKEVGAQKAMSTTRVGKFYFISDGEATKIKVAWEGAASTIHSVNVSCFRNCDEKEPIHKQTEWEEKASATSAEAPSVTTTAAKCRIIASGGYNLNFNEVVAITEPWNCMFRNVGTFAHRYQAAAGASAKPTFTHGVARATLVQTIALQPPQEAASTHRLRMLP